MVKPLLLLGDPKLKRPNSPILRFNSKTLRQLVTDLRDTMEEAQLIGIAATQIGVNKSLFITHIRNTSSRSNVPADVLRVFINPTLVKSSTRLGEGYEGCGCVPGLFGPVKRPSQVTVRAYDEGGNLFELTADGLMARLIQHEMDHLQGVEFIQKVTDNVRLVSKDYYVSHIKNSAVQKRASAISVLKVTMLPQKD